MRLAVGISVVCLVCLLACGSNPDPSLSSNIPTATFPLIQRISPASGAAGTEVNLFGIGFSIVAAENILHIDGHSTVASSYSLLDNPTEGEVEQLTFTIPEGVTTGEHNPFITVIDTPSNTTLVFQVTP